MILRSVGLGALLLGLAGVSPGCGGGGIEPGMANDLDKQPLDPGGDSVPNMSGPSTAPPPPAGKARRK